MLCTMFVVIFNTNIYNIIPSRRFKCFAPRPTHIFGVFAQYKYVVGQLSVDSIYSMVFINVSDCIEHIVRDHTLASDAK